MLKRPKPGEYQGTPDDPYDDPAFRSEFPSLHEYLTQAKWDDGSLRTTSTLLIFIDQGVLRLCLNDRENSRSCFFTAAEFGEGMAKLESALATGKVEWRMKGNSSRDGAKTPF